MRHLQGRSRVKYRHCFLMRCSIAWEVKQFFRSHVNADLCSWCCQPHRCLLCSSSPVPRLPSKYPSSLGRQSVCVLGAVAYSSSLSLLSFIAYHLWIRGSGWCSIPQSLLTKLSHPHISRPAGCATGSCSGLVQWVMLTSIKGTI